ncbi:MAG: hypothetical protein HC906_03800 [Bacteroidales bacterium]|nr:hypothetical protein [Bacteroidales bacterium]
MNTLVDFDENYGYDTPEYYEIQTCYNALIQLKEGQKIKTPVFDFKKSLQTALRDTGPSDIIIFDGLFAAWEPLNNLADYILYIESPLLCTVYASFISKQL